MKKRNKITLKGMCNWRAIGTLVVIMVCLVSVMSPALTQSSLSLFNNASNATDGEKTEPTPAATPTPVPTPTLSPTLTPTPLPEPTPAPSPTPSPTPTPSPSPTPTPGPTPTLTPTPSPTLTPSPVPTPSPAAPNITSFAPSSPVYNTEGETITFATITNQTVNVSWLLNGTVVKDIEKSVTEASYTNTTPAVGIWNITAIASNKNGAVSQTWIWNVSLEVTPTPSPIPTPTPTPTPAPSPEPTPILSSNAKPSTPFYIYGYVAHENGTQCYAPLVVITNLNTSKELIAENRTESDFYQLVTNLSFVNASDVLQINASKNGMSVGNATHIVTTKDIFCGVIEEVNINEEPDLVISESGISIPPLRVNKTNEINVTVWNDGTGASSPFNVSFSVSKGNETEYEAEIRVPGLKHDLYVNISYSWMPTSEGSYNITISVDSNNEIEELNESNNNLTMTVFVGTPDFTVTNIAFNPSELLIGDIIEITATIANLGAKNDTVNVKFYDNKSIEANRTKINRTEPPHYSEKWFNDTFTLPGALEIRLHFSHRPSGCIMIYDKNNQPGKIEGSNWTDWASGDTIRIQSNNAGFTVDGYEVLLVNKSVSLDAKKSTDVSVNWNLSLQEFGWATSGEHNITVIVDPSNQIVEYDEENNVNETEIPVNASLDFAVTNISLDPTEPLLNDTVKINATIANLGKRDGTTIVEAYYDNRSIEIEREGTSTDNISLPAGVLGARLHFDYISIDSLGYVDIYKNDTKVKHIYKKRVEDYWTDYIYSDVIRIESHNANFKIDRYEASIKNETVTLNASQNKTQTFSVDWIANTTYGGAGDHNISVKIDPHDSIVETNETNNTQIAPIFVNGTDLAVTNIEVPCLVGHFGMPCYRGKNVSITVTIANLGALNASNFSFSFMDGLGEGNTSGFVFNTTPVQPLNSGENRSINVTWTPTDIGKHTITAVIPFDNTDNNRTNNKWSANVSVKPEYDFSVENVSVYPKEVNETEEVTIVAKIGNSGRTSGNVSVGFYANVTDFAGSGDERFIKIGKTDDPVPVEVGGENNASITWNANVTGGHHQIFAVVDPDNNLSEWPDDITIIGESLIFKDTTRAGNNVKSCTLHVIKPDLRIKTLTLDPPEPVIENMVNITAVVENKGNKTENSTVWFYMEKNVSIEPDYWYLALRTMWNRSLSQPEQPEEIMMRAHFDHIELKSLITSGEGYVISYGVITAYVDGQPVFFYVKSEDVAKGQPVKVPRVDFDTPCAKCMFRNLSAVCTEKRWEDVWTNWSRGNKFEVGVVPSGQAAHFRLLIDKYQVRLGNRTVTIDASSNSSYNVTWNASLPLNAGENYTLMANVEDELLQKETYLGGTDLVVTNVSVKEEVMDGDRVIINATIENLGGKNATNFSVSFFEVYVPQRYIGATKPRENLELINTTPIEGLDAGNSTNISFVLWNASIRDILCMNKGGSMSWHEIADNYTIKVKINLLNNTDFEVNKTNDYNREARVDVNRSRDFSSSVMNLSFSVNGTLRDPQELELYDNVTVNATLNITNLANQNGSVNVSFYLDDAHEIGNVSNISFDTGNETKTRYAVLRNWHVENFNDVSIPGDHNITVVADPENKTHEICESNNASTWQIHVKAPELTVTDISFNPERPVEGETVNITVTIANNRDKNATNVTLSVYDWADMNIENVGEYTDLGHMQIEIERGNATAMRLYLDLKIEGEGGGGEVSVYDSMGTEIECYEENFHGWTLWVLDNNITVVANGDAYAKVSKVYYLGQPGEPFNTTTMHDLAISKTANISVDWHASTVGERFIAATIDPEKNITEYDESNNRKAEYITVKTVDFEVSNLSLRWLNGTEIGKNATIRDNDTVKISANVTNSGIEETDDYSVYFLVDGVPIPEGKKILPNLAKGLTEHLVANWTAEVGMHVIKVEVDYNNEIDETNETNNIEALERYVHGAEVSGNTSWESLGLHGLNGTILFDPAQPYDEDNVNITAVINNLGQMNATNFSVALLFDYKPSDEIHKFSNEGKKSWDLNYDNARCTYLYFYINPTRYQVFGIYDRNDTEIARTDKTCWVRVPGDEAKVEEIVSSSIGPSSGHIVYSIYFYPVYNANLTKAENLTVNANSSADVSIKVRNVTAGNHSVFLFIDPEGKVPEDMDNKTDNVVSEVMEVLPTRDFTVTNVTVAKPKLSDLDTTEITARVANVGLRNGTTKVDFVDYEYKTRLYKYYFDKNLSLSYLPISPDTYVSSDKKNLTIIHRPGVDAIQLHFNQIALGSGGFLKPSGKIWICDDVCKYEEALWRQMHVGDPDAPNTREDFWIPCWIPEDTVYVYTSGRAYFNLSGYNTKHKFNRSEVTLKNATRDDSGNITKVWSEPIEAMWNASTGTHNITVTIDSDDETIEMNETNNTCVHQLSVNTSRDVTIENITFDPLHPSDGDNVTIRAFVQNKGFENNTVNFTVDLWAETTRRITGSTPEPDANWSRVQGDKTRYIRLLTHDENVQPGEDGIAEVNATWNDMSVFGDPTYIVRAIVDPLDEIDELNESNNEKSEEIEMNYPDLTVTGFNSPTRAERKASAIIENKGAANATTEFNVSFELIKHEGRAEGTGVLNISNDNDTTAINITMEGATKIRIHFASLDTTGENSYIDIWGKDGKRYDGYPKQPGEGRKRENVWTEWVKGDTIYIEYSNADFYIDGYECGNIYKKEGASKMRICFDWLDTKGENSHIDIYEKKGEGEWNRVETYSGEESGYTCTPWAKGDTILIDYAGKAYFHMKELWWKEANIITIKTLNASESVNVSLPTWKYEGVEVLNVTVDPDNKIMEQKEDDNTRTVTIYADLVSKEVGTVFAGDGDLKGVNATILNDKTLEEERGIIFPVCNFNVELRYSSGERIQTKRIGESENETIYGGEEREVLFEVNESTFAANRTYEITVIADADDEVEEIDEWNNYGDPTPVGPDISVGEIHIKSKPGSGSLCKGEVVALIKNEGNANAKDFDVRLYLNCTSCTTWDRNKTLDSEKITLSANEEINWSLWDIPVEPNEFYDVKVVADPPDQEHPGGRVEELDEGNNAGEKLGIGPDLTIVGIEFYTHPKGARRGADKLIVNEKQTISVRVNNLDVGAKDVNNGTFKLELWINDSNNNTIYKNKTIACATPNALTPVDFLWEPTEKGFYYMKAEVDTRNAVPEIGENGENNNIYPLFGQEIEVKVAGPNYKAKTDPIIPVKSDTVPYGGMYYDAIGSYESYHPGNSSTSDTYGDDIEFENRIPDGGNSVYARLYLYMFGYVEDPDHPDYDLGKLPGVDMEFYVNDIPVGVSSPSTHKEPSDATKENWTYATFAYTVPSFEAGDDLKAIASFNGTGLDTYAVSGMGLVVAYADDDGVLTRYYIGEDGDIIMAKNDAWFTGFEYDDCTRDVIFNGVGYPELANATLITVLAPYAPYGAPIDSYSYKGEEKPWGDLLLFNDKPVGEPIDNTHFWVHYTTGNIALTNPNEERGEYVNVEKNNTAKIRSRGNYLFLTNAFLNVTYPPDLEPHVEKELYATVGNPYDIEVNINNLGLSKAKNFTVIVSIDGVEVKNETIAEINEVGQDGSSIPLRLPPQDARQVEGWVEHNVTVKVDTEDNVKELINTHRRGKHFWEWNGEKNNEIINETVTVEVGPPGPGEDGRGGGTGGGWGEGTGEGEGAGEGEGEGTGGAGGEGALGGSGGKLIRGYLMKGSVASSEEEGGGGGKGEFSWVAWLIRLAMLAVAAALVCAGYLHERRRQNNKLSLEKKV